MSHTERRILVVTCFGHYMAHFNMLVFPSIVLPLSVRLGLDLATVLKLSFWQYLLFGVTALPWGLAADRWGAKPLLIIFFLGAGLSGLAAALYMDSPFKLTLALAGLGCFSGIYHPAGLGLISKNVTRLSMGMAYNGMFGNLGLASAPLMAGVVNWSLGSPATYIFLAGLNLVGFLLMFFLPIEEARVEAVAAPASNPGHASISPFLILLIAMMLAGITYRGATVILPTYFEVNCRGLYDLLAAALPMGISANLMATALASIIYLIGVLGQYSGGWVGEHREVRRSYLVYHALTLPPVFLMAYTQNLLLVGLAVVYFFFLLGMQPLENTLVARLSPERFRHSAYGAKFILTFGVGALSVQMVGLIEGAWGITAVFPSLGLVTIAIVGSVLVLMALTAPIKVQPGK